jgi:hypothetical protein
MLPAPIPAFDDRFAVQQPLANDPYPYAYHDYGSAAMDSLDAIPASQSWYRSEMQQAAVPNEPLLLHNDFQGVADAGDFSLDGNADSGALQVAPALDHQPC